MSTNLLKSPKLTKRVLTIQNKKQTIAYIYLLITLVTVSFFGFFALRPAFSIIARLQKQLADDQNVLSKLEDKLSALVSLDKEYRQIEPNLDLVYEAIPTTPDAAALVRQIQKVAQQNNMQINSLETGTIKTFPPTEGNSVASYTFTMNVEGTQKDFQSFLTLLVSFNRAVSLNRVATDKNSAGVLQANIEGTAYYLPNAQVTK